MLHPKIRKYISDVGPYILMAVVTIGMVSLLIWTIYHDVTAPRPVSTYQVGRRVLFITSGGIEGMVTGANPYTEQYSVVYHDRNGVRHVAVDVGLKELRPKQ